MDPRLAPTLIAQAGLLTRSQAVEAGVSERSLKTLTGARGPWLPVRRGVYLQRTDWPDDEDSRYRLRIRAALLTMTSADVTLSHASAAAYLGLPLMNRWRDWVHVTRDDIRGGRLESGVKHHRAHLSPESTTLVEGVRVTGLARTALDIAREGGLESGVVAVDAALRRGVTPVQMADELQKMTCWPGITQSRQALALGDAGAETPGESLMRLLVHELGFGVPETQYLVTDGRRTAYADLRIGNHLFEFDGRVKYRRTEEGGVATGPVSDVLWDEKLREDWLRSLGYGVSRVVWADLIGPARRRTLERLRSEVAATLRRTTAAG